MPKKSNKKKSRVPATVTRKELLTDGSDSEFREMVHHALAFASRLPLIRDGYGRLLGLTGTEYTVLISVGHLEDEMDVGVKTLADHLMLTGAFLTTEVNKLVDKQLLKKVVNPRDKRRVILTVTEKGADLLATLAPLQQQVNDVHFGSLSKEEFEQLHALFPKIAESTEKALSLLAHLTENNSLKIEHKS